MSKAECLTVARIGDLQGRLNYLEALDKILIRELERIDLNAEWDVQRLVLLQQTLVATGVNKRRVSSQAIPNR